MLKRFSKKEHINKSDHKTQNNNKDNTSSITKSKSDKTDSEITVSSDLEFIDDDYSDPSDLLKLPQYTFEKIDNDPHVKGILRHPKELYKEKSLSFKKGNIDKSNLKQCHQKINEKTEKLVKFKSVFNRNIENKADSNEKDILLKKYRKDIAQHQKEIHTWSTRAENVYTARWSFKQKYKNERIRSIEEKTRLPKDQIKVQKYKIKCETSIRNLGLHIKQLEHKILNLENLLEGKRRLYSINKIDLSLSSSYKKNLKKLEKTKLLKSSCSENFNDLKIKQKKHMMKYPIYYIYQPK
ncbi:MAG: hypothetical protein KFW09_01920 [Oscillospiraceae bacterium]|nr:hypothetical protein [Oscillospiraceae bacterium]